MLPILLEGLLLLAFEHSFVLVEVDGVLSVVSQLLVFKYAILVIRSPLRELEADVRQLLTDFEVKAVEGVGGVSSGVPAIEVQLLIVKGAVYAHK